LASVLGSWHQFSLCKGSAPTSNNAPTLPLRLSCPFFII
jgi:hypothetical protein